MNPQSIQTLYKSLANHYYKIRAHQGAKDELKRRNKNYSDYP